MDSLPAEIVEYIEKFVIFQDDLVALLCSGAPMCAYLVNLVRWRRQMAPTLRAVGALLCVRANTGLCKDFGSISFSTKTDEDRPRMIHWHIGRTDSRLIMTNVGILDCVVRPRLSNTRENYYFWAHDPIKSHCNEII